MSRSGWVRKIHHVMLYGVLIPLLVDVPLWAIQELGKAR